MTLLSKPIFSKGDLGLGLLATMIISTASLYAPLANAAPIYKVIDEKTGQVTFTDRPQNYEQQAGKQVTQTSVMTRSDTFSSSNNGKEGSQPSQVSDSESDSATATADAKNSAAVKPPVDYQLAITEPNEERAYRRPAQSIDINVQVKPALQAGDSVTIYLDGNEVAQGLSASIATIDILPGSHSVKAVLTNEKGQATKQVERTVHVIQNNTTLQNNKKIAQQLLAYKNLPWYEKVKLKMRRKDSDAKKPQSSQPVTNNAFVQ